MTAGKYNRGVYNTNNPYGYRLNVNHPKIRELLERYEQANGIPHCCPLSDAQRKEFEKIIIERMKRK